MLGQLQIWDQGNNRFGAVPKVEKIQKTQPPASSSSKGTSGSHQDGDKA